jgi:hypothetical protein
MAGCCSPARRRGSVLTGPRPNTLLAEVRSTIDQWPPVAACAALRGVNADFRRRRLIGSSKAVNHLYHAAQCWPSTLSSTFWPSVVLPGPVAAVPAGLGGFSQHGLLTKPCERSLSSKSMGPTSHQSCTDQGESPWPPIRPNRRYRERVVAVEAAPADGGFVGIVQR